MGGAIAMDLGLRHAARVEALILSCTAPKFNFTPDRIEGLRAITMGRAPQAFNTDGYSPKTAKENFDVVREGWMEQIKTDPRVRYTDILACSQVDLREAIAKIDKPTLVLAGADEKAPRPPTRSLSRAKFAARPPRLSRTPVITFRASVPPSTTPQSSSSFRRCRTEAGIEMSINRKTAVAGVFEHPTRFAPDKSLFQIMAESVRGALDDAGLTIKDVNGLCTTGIGMSGMGIIGFCDYLNLTPNFVDSTSIGGSSFVAHTAHAAAAIHAGLCDVCVVVYGSTAASSRFAIGTGGGGRRRRRSVRPVRDSVRADHGRRVRDDRAAPHARLRHHARSNSQRLRSRCGCMRR